MDSVDVYDVWAGDDPAWEMWTMPALFAQLPAAPRLADTPGGHQYRERSLPWPDVDVSWAPAAGEGTCIVVDLDGAASITLGFRLMSHGYRPVVAINACTGAGEAIGMRPVIDALWEGARFPHAFPRGPGAPPAFLLDARRIRPTRPLVPGVLDNRWMIFRQDLPSAARLRHHGISRVLLVLGEDAMADDLRHVLYAWQQGGLAIAVKHVDRAQPPELTTIEAPSWLRRFLGHPIGAGDLRRNAQGSFGARIPEPSHG